MKPVFRQSSTTKALEGWFTNSKNKISVLNILEVKFLKSNFLRLVIRFTERVRKFYVKIDKTRFFDPQQFTHFNSYSPRIHCIKSKCWSLFNLPTTIIYSSINLIFHKTPFACLRAQAVHRPQSKDQIHHHIRLIL